MKPLTVNEVIDRLPELRGCCIATEGILQYEFEDHSLRHWPKAERDGGYGLWLDPDGPTYGFVSDVMQRWSGKRVVILGVVDCGEPSTMEGWHGGFGHMGLWEAEIRVRRIDLRKRWLKDHPECNDDAVQGVLPRASDA